MVVVVLTGVLVNVELVLVDIVVVLVVVVDVELVLVDVVVVLVVLVVVVGNTPQILQLCVIRSLPARRSDGGTRCPGDAEGHN